MQQFFAALILLIGLGFLSPSRLQASNQVYGNTQLRTEKAEISKKQSRKTRRLQKWIEKYARSEQHNPEDRWLWMGLFGLGLGLALALFSTTLAGIVSAAALACLVIWGFYKLGAL